MSQCSLCGGTFEDPRGLCPKCFPVGPSKSTLSIPATDEQSANEEEAPLVAAQEGEGEAVADATPTEETLRPAGLRVRIVAALADTVILGIFSQMITAILLSVGMGLSTRSLERMLVQLKGSPAADVVLGGMIPVLVSFAVGMSIAMVVFVLLGYAYFVLGENVWGGSPGKLVLGLRVLKQDAPERISFVQANARYIAKILGWVFSAGIYLLLVPLRKDRRALHDILAQTRVVRLESASPARSLGILVCCFIGLSIMGFLSSAMVVPKTKRPQALVASVPATPLPTPLVTALPTIVAAPSPEEASPSPTPESWESVEGHLTVPGLSIELKSARAQYVEGRDRIEVNFFENALSYEEMETASPVVTLVLSFKGDPIEVGADGLHTYTVRIYQRPDLGLEFAIKDPTAEFVRFDTWRGITERLGIREPVERGGEFMGIFESGGKLPTAKGTIPVKWLLQFKIPLR